MSHSPAKPADFFKTACTFEAALGLLALFLGWLVGIDPFANCYFSESAMAYGIIGTVPLFLLFLSMEHIPHDSLARIRQFLLNTLGPNLHRYHWTDLLILATIAGIGEELLFRGVLQPWLELSLTVPVSLIVSNIVFGLAHALTPLYAVLAGAVGIYLGLAMDIGGERNLLIPIIIHSLYDFLAFMVFLRAYRASLATNDSN